MSVCDDNYRTLLAYSLASTAAAAGTTGSCLRMDLHKCKGNVLLQSSYQTNVNVCYRQTV